MSDTNKINDAWLNLRPDLNEDLLFNPMEFVYDKCEGDITKIDKYLSLLMTKPEYFSFVCKYIFNVQISPLQAVLLADMWNRKFPMLIGSRGLSKSFSLALYSMLRAFLLPQRKIVVVGAAFRQSKVLYDYCDTIWKNAPVLRDICDSNSGLTRDVDRCQVKINDGTVVFLPLGDGCLTANTSVMYGDRFGLLGDLFDPKYKDEMDVPNFSRLLLYDGQNFRNSPHRRYNGLKQTIKITTELGYEIEGTLDHKMMSFSGWKKLKDFRIGDLLEINLSGDWHSGWSNLTENEAYQMGVNLREEIPKPILSSPKRVVQSFLRGVFHEGVYTFFGRGEEMGMVLMNIISRFGQLSQIKNGKISLIEGGPPSGQPYYDKVVRIEHRENYTYDFELDVSHKYLANSMISHNSKIRGQRGHDILADEFASLPRDIFENVVAGFAAVASSPIEKMKKRAADDYARKMGIEVQQEDVSKLDFYKSNQIILSGTAYYDFNHFADYWKRYCAIVKSGGDPHKLAEVFGGEVPGDFNWKDYAVYRIPVDLLPPGYMDEGQIARSKATVHSGIFDMEYGACQLPDTPIYTTKGTKKIQDVKIGDLVLTHKGRFKPVTKVMFRRYRGQIAQLKTYGYHKNLEFTPNHPFWTGSEDFSEISLVNDSVRLARVSQLSGKTEIDVRNHCSNYMERSGKVYPQPSSSIINNKQRNEIFTMIDNGESVTSVARKVNLCYSAVHNIIKRKNITPPKTAIPTTVKLDYNFGLVLGYYASEGSVGANGKAVEFALDGHVDKTLEYFIDELKSAICSSIGIRPRSVTGSTNAERVYVNSRLFAEMMKSICPGKCYDKLVDHDTLFSNEDFMKGFIVGIWNGDGHIRKTGNVATLTLANESMILQIKLVLSYFGINSSLGHRLPIKNHKIRGKNVNSSEAFSLTISGVDFRKFIKIFYSEETSSINGKNYVYCDDISCVNIIKNKEYIDYDGFVYNLEVEDDHSYSTPVATVHNCFSTDSKGFFKRSLIESCVCSEKKPIVLPSGEVFFSATTRGNTQSKYIIGVDPASEEDNFSIVVLEIMPDHRRVVYAWTTTRERYRESFKANITNEDNFYGYCARKIRDLMKTFPTVEIALDSQGGGVAVMEALHDRDKLQAGELAIWPTIDPDKPAETDGEPGLHILKLCKFVDSMWTAEANHGLRKDLEDKVLIFPFFDSATLGFSLEDDKKSNRTSDTLEDCVIEIEQLKDELALIVLTQTASGREKWDTPHGGFSSKTKSKLRKDRYSALLMANDSARRMLVERTGIEYDEDYCRTVGFAERFVSKESGRDNYHGPAWFIEGAKDLY